MLVSSCAVLLLVCNVWAQTPNRNATATFCGSPPVLLNARVSVNGDTEGSIATYNCQDGYLASGSMESICRGGLWVVTGPSPKCQEQYCPALPNVPNSSNSARFGVQNPVGSVIRYNCYSGHRVNGTDQVVCLSNLTWSSPKPVCSPLNCGLPPVSAHINVSYSSTFYPSSAVYTCAAGYKLVNPNQFGTRNPPSLSVSCQYTGIWGNTPTCQPVTCRPPAPILNGHKVTGSSYTYSDIVMYGCDVGYTIRGSEVVTCQESGTWSPYPQCVVVNCSSPPVVANSTITSTPTVKYGNSSYYHCHEGFYMTGFSHVTCKADGTWTDPPSCNIVNCRSPPAILFGKHTWTSTTFKSNATYTCDKGYKLIGVSQVTCLADGSWDSTPSCQSTAATGASRADAQYSGQSVSDSSATIASLAVAVAVMGLITLFFLVFFAFKIYPHKSRLFSYASYKNGDESVNSNI